MASPTFVNWKKSHRRTTTPSETQIVPMSWYAIATSPTRNVPDGNGLSTARTSPDQISCASPLIRISKPIVTITTRSTEPRSFGRITSW